MWPSSPSLPPAFLFLGKKRVRKGTGPWGNRVFVLEPGLRDPVGPRSSGRSDTVNLITKKLAVLCS